MEANKENVRRTKIPLPKEPLPALPKHLLEEPKKTLKHDFVLTRAPLKTINSEIWPKPGPSKITTKPKFLMNVDTRHVTLRRRSEGLDWNFSVFKDKKADQDSSAVSISDDEVYLDIEKKFDENRKKSDLGNGLSAVTPNLKGSLEPSRVKNIKRSLKRPHSRELQGLSPIVKQAKEATVDDKVKRKLQFSERMQDRLESTDFWMKSYMKCLNRDYTEDILDYLLAVEAKPFDIPNTSSITRACVINWLIKVNGTDGNPSTIQTACWYLDSILGTGYIHLDKLQLVAAACYWIAQKIHGPVVTAARLVKCANRAFTVEKLLSAEKIVLLRLKFPSQPVVVQDYINYLAWYCDHSCGGELAVAATFLSMCGLMVDKILCDEYPSVIAAAAVKNALLFMKKKDLMARLQTCRVFRVAEKKSKKMALTCSILRRAVRTVSTPVYEYKAPLEQYSSSPGNIAQKIVKAANEMYILDAKCTSK